METDEEDTAWLEACVAAVDSLPAANLPVAARTSTTTSNTTRDTMTAASSLASSVASKSATAGSTSHHAVHVSTDRQPPLLASVRRSTPVSTLPNCINDTVWGRATSDHHGGNKRSTPSVHSVESVNGQSGKGIGAAQGVQGPYGRSLSGQRAFKSRMTSGKTGRFRGIGAHPEDEMRELTKDTGSENIDPCWKCGEPMVVKYLRNGSLFWCSSHPFCKVTRTSNKNSPVIELTAEEATASTGESESNSTTISPEDEAEHAGITRCHLAIRVRGVHQDAAAAQATWDILRRNGIIPTTPTTQHPGERERERDVKAVLALSKREFVRRLAKKEKILYRDIPQTTYSRLASSGAGRALAADADDSCPRKRKAPAESPRSLEPYAKCERLLHMLPAMLRDTLLLFQREGVMYGLRRRGRCMIADEMGTGKTLQALGVMGCYKEDWPLLIVAPASMRLMWAEEVERWYPFLAPSDLHLIRGNKDKLYLADVDRLLWPRVTIVSYFMLRMLADSIGKDDWKAVIFDESHTISTKLGGETAQSQQVSVCLEVAARAKRVVLLTGTPSLSKPFDLFNQVEAISPILLGRPQAHIGKYDFASNYCQGAIRVQKLRAGNVVRVPYISGCEYADELHLLLKNEVMIRRLKANVVDQLPPLRRIVVRVAEHSELLKRALDEGGYDEEDESKELQTVGGDGSGGRDSTGARSRRGGMHSMSDDQQAGLKKVRSASEWIVDKLFASEETKTKFVVFAHHKIVIDRLQEAFELAGMRQNGHRNAGQDCGAIGSENSVDDTADGAEGYFGCLRIDGEVPTALRAARLTEFNTNDSCRVLLVSITAGGQGLDFTAASNVVFVELPKSPAWLRQAEDRLHRRRQEKSVNVYLTVLPPGSHDDNRWLSLSQRLTAQSSVVNGTAEAENIDVDEVFRAGGLADGADNGRRHTRGLACAPGAIGVDVGNASDGEGDGAGDADSVHETVSGGSDRGTDDMPEFASTYRTLDAEVAAMLLTPVDVGTQRASQSPTLRLLRELADYPNPTETFTPVEERSVTKRKAKVKTMDDSFGSQEGVTSGGSVRGKAKGSDMEPLDNQSGRVRGDGVQKLYQGTRVAGPTAGVSSSTPKSGFQGSAKGEPADRSRERDNSARAPSSKRARSTYAPRTAGTDGTDGSPSACTTWREWERATPLPPPPRRRRSTSGSPSGRHVCTKSEVGTELSKPLPRVEENRSSKVKGSNDKDLMGKNTVSELCGAGGVGSDNHDLIYSTGGQGSSSPPSEVVDLSAVEADDDKAVERFSRTPDVGGDDHVDFYADADNDLDLGLSSPRRHEKARTPHKGRAPQAEEEEVCGELKRGPEGVSDYVLSPARSPLSPARRKSERLLDEGEKEEDDERRRNDVLASRLMFAVSGNTGRVHVYKQGGDDDGSDSDVNLWDGCDAEHGQRAPRHCRCNFRPEDLDRLLAAAKSWSEGGDAANCRGSLREALRVLPTVLWSAPALRVAAEFVREWRALPARKRPLLIGKPCRPPLAETLQLVTPKLTGSTQRYSDRAIGGAKGAKQHLGNPTAQVSTGSSSSRRSKESIDKEEVLCLFCAQPASVQAPAVHRRDRFCSAACMEAYSSRNSGTSLRRLVSERDGGVCCKEGCGIDCQALVSRLKAVQEQQKRREILIAADARFQSSTNRNLRERLVRQPKAGHAWHADHVTAVFEGGGQCGVDNLRTLCVVCHAEVTREQAKERAAARAISRLREAATSSLPGQQRLVSLGGGVNLSHGTATPSRDRASEIDALDLAREDDGSSDDGVSDSVMVQERARRTSAIIMPGSACGSVSAADRNPSFSDDSSFADGRKRIASEVTPRPRTAKPKKGWSEALRASGEKFERLISGEEFSSPNRSSNSRCAAAAGTDGAGGNGIGNSDSDGNGIVFTRVRRVSRPKKPRQLSSSFKRQNEAFLDIDNSSDAD